MPFSVFSPASFIPNLPSLAAPQASSLPLGMPALPMPMVPQQPHAAAVTVKSEWSTPATYESAATVAAQQNGATMNREARVLR